jgi:uncharacterized protein (DUF1778 family)
MSAEVETLTQVTVTFLSEDMAVIRKAAKAHEVSLGDFIKGVIMKRSRSIVSRLED